MAAVRKGINADVLIISHLHLLVFASIVKKLKPKIRIVLFAHGIEIWAVSQYTAAQVISRHGINQTQIKVLNNSIDPFLKISNVTSKPNLLLNKYAINSGQKVLLTICRLSSAEQYKGYDLVIKSLKNLSNSILILFIYWLEKQMS